MTKPAWKVFKSQAVFLLLHLAAVGIFTCGFLLTRVELNDISTCNQFKDITHTDYCSNPRFSKAVVIIVDALRFDVFHTTSMERAGHQNHLPLVKRLLYESGTSAVSAKFVADPPTTTMQRLKAMLTGVLPTFVDVGNSFSASAVTEDNLADQLHGKGRRIVFMGDDTWTQLVPHVFSQSYAYPSFNVKDLHTVDNGVWEHLVPLLQAPDDWDVLLAHYLGVDHAGHTHGVNSQQMRDKLQQMDQQIANMTEYLLSQAGEGGPHEHTLLVILSDHGQTMLGDHGGGSAEEVDSVFLAFNLAAAHRKMRSSWSNTATSEAEPAAHSTTWQQKNPESAARQEAAEGQGERKGRQGDRACQGDGETMQRDSACQDGREGRQQDNAVSVEREDMQRDSASHGYNISCFEVVVPQLDFTATMAAWLGVPIPFGNVGKVSPHLWRLLINGGRDLDCQAPLFSSWEPSDILDYVHALMVNAAQVQRYLTAYSSRASLPATPLAHCAKLYKQAAEFYSAHAESRPAEAAQKLLDYLEEAAEMARRQFTQFNLWLMGLGCGGMALTVVWQLMKTWQAFGGFGSWCWSVKTLSALVCIGFHAGAIFSTNLIMAEGRVQCALVATLSLLLLRSCLAAAWKLRRKITFSSSSYRTASPLTKSNAPASPVGYNLATQIQHRFRDVPSKHCSQEQDVIGEHDDQEQSISNKHGSQAQYVTSRHGNPEQDTDSKHHNRACRGTSTSAGTSNNAGPLSKHFLTQPAAVDDSMRSARRSCVAAVVLVSTCVGLWRYGLIDRAGQDPHDKSQMEAEQMQGHNLGSVQQAALVQLPLVLLPLVFHWSIRAVGAGKGVRSWSALVVWLEYGLVALWWNAQSHAGWKSTSLHDLLLASTSHYQSPQSNTPILSHFLHLPRLLASWLTAQHPPPSPPQHSIHSLLQLLDCWLHQGLQLPLRLLLPRLVFLLCSAWVIAGCLLLSAGYTNTSRGGGNPVGRAGRGGTGFYYKRDNNGVGDIRSATSAIVATAGVLSGPVTMLLGVKGPLVVLLAAIQWAATAGWVQQMSVWGHNPSIRDSALCVDGSSPSLAVHDGHSLPGSAAASVRISGACLWSGVKSESGRRVEPRETQDDKVKSESGRQSESGRKPESCKRSESGNKSGTSQTSGTGTKPESGEWSQSDGKSESDGSLKPRLQLVSSLLQRTDFANGSSTSGMVFRPGGDKVGGDGGSFLVSALAAMQGVQLFFCSGHFCEFSGLQYPSSFVGFDDMHWYRSGLLLLANTFGLHCLAYFLLPALAALMLPSLLSRSTGCSLPQQYKHPQCSTAMPAQAQLEDTQEEFTPSSTAHARIESQSKEEPPHVLLEKLSEKLPEERPKVLSEEERRSTDGELVLEQYVACLERVMLVAGLVRGLNALVAVISAVYQRRHLLVWALFAPKLVFEVWLLAMSHVASLAALAIIGFMV